MRLGQRGERRIAARASLVGSLVATLGLAGCGSGAVTPPDVAVARPSVSDAPTHSRTSPAAEPSGTAGTPGPLATAQRPATGGDDHETAGARSLEPAPRHGATAPGAGADAAGRDAPSTEDSDEAERRDGAEPDPPPPRAYTWWLPPADSSPSGNEGSFYGRLLRCTGAVEELQGPDWWQGFNSPRNALLYMAAAHLCRGETESGRPYYDAATTSHGWAGLGAGSRQCLVYQSVSSVLLQAPPEQFTCDAAGDVPGWRQSATGEADNPLTLDVDESQAPRRVPADPEEPPFGDGRLEDPRVEPPGLRRLPPLERQPGAVSDDDVD